MAWFCFAEAFTQKITTAMLREKDEQKEKCTLQTRAHLHDHRFEQIPGGFPVRLGAGIAAFAHVELF